MTRRDFLGTSAAAGAAALGVAVWGQATAAGPGSRVRALPDPDSFPDDVRIRRVTGLHLESRRPKLVGRNSHLDVHGDRGSDFLVLVETSAGVTGLGTARNERDAAAELLGTDPFAYYRPEQRRIESPLGRGDMPLWDLIGKLLERPVYELLGAAGPERVPVYDGSIYFADLLPEYAQRWADRFRQEIDMGLEAGHRAFKVKVGRGFRWMPRKEGDARDAEVLRVIRAHAGPEVLIGIDANNGFDLMGTLRFFDDVGALDIAFAEEMFPETVEEDLRFGEFLRDQGWTTLVADGESADGPDHFDPFIEARALDIVQPDMKHLGISLQMEMSRRLGDTGIRLAPHNWGSLIGFYMQVQLGRGIANFYRAERDPLATELLIADGYEVEDGACSIPAAPGFGLALLDDVLERVEPAWQVE